MTSLHKHIITLSLSLLLTAAEAVASGTHEEIPDDTLRLRRALPATVVTGRSRESQESGSQTLKSADLEAIGTASVAEAIRQFSGLQIKDYGGIGGLKTVNVRSLGTNHTGIFYDGIELGNAQNGQVDLGRIAIENLEGISLRQDGHTEHLLSAKELASASSIHLHTRAPKFSKDEQRDVCISVKGGSFSTVRPSLSWSERLNSRLSLTFNADYLYTSGKYKFRYRKAGGYDTTAVRQNSDVNALRAELGLHGKSHEGDWQAKANFYSSRRGLPGSVVRGRFWQDDRQCDRNFFVQGSWRRFFSEHYALRFQTKYAFDFLHYRSIPSSSGGSMPADNTFRQNEVYVSLAHEVNFTKTYTLSIATDYQMNQSSSDIRNYAQPTRHTALLALLGNADWERFKLRTGVLGTLVSDHARSITTLRKEVSPSLSVTAHLTKDRSLSFNAFCKHTFRMPTLNDLYYSIVGNANLNPERALLCDAGLRFSPTLSEKGALREFTLKANAYYNRVSNKITAIPTSNQFRWTMYNLGKVRIIGVDANAQSRWHLGKTDVCIRAAYTFQQAKDITSRNDSFYGEQIPYAPCHSGSFETTAGIRGWHFRIAAICTGERFSGRNNVEMNRMKRWTCCDCRIAKSFTAREARITLSAELNNLLNSHYEVVRGYPMPGISCLGGIRAEF